MMTNEDVKRVIKKPVDLEERIEQLEKQKEILKAACKKAGETIKALTKRAQEAEGEMTIVKGIGMNSPEMRQAKAEIETLKADLARAKEDHQYDNLVHQNELKSFKKK
jgi:predicted RNase H-like nuclease (RuvC/YqgF family)